MNLLPTPTARDWKSGASNLHGRNSRPLSEVALLLGGADEAQDWVDFEPAIRRQEALSDRPAPVPTEIGPRGGRRLTARFAEWLMWLPAGHVVDVPDIKRADQLKIIGNGVVPAQAFAAFSHLLSEHESHTEETPWQRHA